MRAAGRYLQPPIPWRTSVAIGRPWKRTLRRGVQLPADGPGHVSYDPARDAVPNRPWRRWGTDRLVRTTLCAIDPYRAAGAVRIYVGPRTGLHRPGGRGIVHILRRHDPPAAG